MEKWAIKEETEKKNELWEDVEETVHSFKQNLPKQFSSPSLTVFTENLNKSCTQIESS